MEAAPGGKRSKLLPESAYRKLKPGEEYHPIVPATSSLAEITSWSVTTGIIMVIIFAAAGIYMALRAGNAIETAIPIAILAISLGRLKQLKSTILENVIVQSIGQASGVVAAGAAFLIPALYINELTPPWWQIFLACFIGGSLGVVLIIPLRKYFVKDLHGELPFPEGTAINEILVSGESTAATAFKVLIIAFCIGAAYDFLVEFFHLWNPEITSGVILGGMGEAMTGIRMDITISGLAALFGLGYIIGLRYASIIAAGSVLSYLVFIPVVYLFGSQMGGFEYAGTVYDIATMSSDQIFNQLVKNIGIGAIAVSGIIGIMKMGKIVIGSISLGFKGLKGGGHAAPEDPRTQLDMSPRNVLLVQFGTAALLGLLFFIVALTTVDTATGQNYSLGDGLLYAAVGAVVGYALSFLFTPVAAQAIAIVGVNPVSGMTLITVVMTILVLVSFGLKGTGGMFVALIVGTAVCTALSTSGALITDFKIGYWIGATPRQQERWKFLGLAVAALVVAFVIPIMDSGYGFLQRDQDTGQIVRDAAGTPMSNTEQLPAPQANMIAAVSRGLLNDPAKQPWLFYGLGGVIAIVLFMAGVPMLAFALGMYLPIAINLAILCGAFTAWIVGKTGGSERMRKARSEQGILIASGLMAGAAIFGILTAILRLPDVGSWFGLGAIIQYLSVGVQMTTQNGLLKENPLHWYEGITGQGLSLAMFVLLGVVCFFLARWGARRTIREEDEFAARQEQRRF
ncbi:MAG: oligopeptide transporter, OPT family [Acidobacteria bacterium]|nr:oligopeptide transporter, OPT family [Acidobacteriota bacterium]